MKLAIDPIRMKKLRTTAIIIILIVTCCILVSCYGDIPLPRPQANSSRPRALAWQGENYLWIIDNHEVIQWDVEQQHIVTRNSEIGYMVMNLFVTAENRVWAYENGTALFESDEWIVRNRDNSSVVLVEDMVQTSDGSVWIAADTAGYFVWNEQFQEWEHSRVPYSGHTLVEGNDGSLWFGLADDGLLQMQGEKTIRWTKNNALIDNEVYSLLVASDDSVWVGTRWGIHRWDGIEWQKWDELGLLDPDGPVISRIFEAENGEIWIAVETHVARWDGQEWIVSEILRGLNSFVETDDGILWAACDSGLYRWNGSIWHEYGETEGISDNRVSYLVEGSNGILYVATISGLYQYVPDKDRWQPFPKPDN